MGDIEIRADRSFVRTFGKGSHRRREGIYSPVTQNARHVELMRAIIRAENGRLVSGLVGNAIDAYFHSVVVLANDKSLLSMSHAPAEVRRQVVRCDQLVNYIKAADEASRKGKDPKDSFAGMERNGRGWLARSKPVQVDLAGRYAIAGRRGDQMAKGWVRPSNLRMWCMKRWARSRLLLGTPRIRCLSVPCAVAPWC